MASSALAVNRFGLGTRPDEPVPADPKRWLLSQFDRFEPRLAGAPARDEVAGQLADYLAAPRRPRPEDSMQKASMVSKPEAEPAPDPRMVARQASRDYYREAIEVRTDAALDTTTPFVERLTHFWSNHFAVSAEKLTVVGLAGLLEFEAIRPHVLGRFSDMLLAVEQHPAMLLYLDQAQSIGPDSPVGARLIARGRRNAGLNENLAREILELHTLGVRTGYSQGDVTELARALTGWTVAGLSQGPGARLAGLDGPPGEFQFAPRLHQPGARNLLGRSYDQPGEAQARAILMDLAVHPSTARHIATKLARHFAGDDPPPALIDRLSNAFLKSKGDLPTVYRALIDAPEAWTPGIKFKTPWEWTVSAYRATGTREVRGQQVNNLLAQLGQPVWKPGSPAGYDDIAASWAGPDALVRRVEAAERLASRSGDSIDARALAPRLLGETLTPATVQAIARAESPAQGLALLLVSPEFLRR